MKSKPRFLPIGSISAGTLRPEDVIPELVWIGAGRRLRMSREDRRRFDSLSREWEAISDRIERESAYPGIENAEDSEPAAEIWEELGSILSAYAPPGCYFGSHPGDGADIGVWYSEDLGAFEAPHGPEDGESEADYRRRRHAAIEEADRRIGAGTVLELSDHGNVLAVWGATYLSDRTVWRRVPNSCYR